MFLAAVSEAMERCDSATEAVSVSPRMSETNIWHLPTCGSLTPRYQPQRRARRVRCHAWFGGTLPSGSVGASVGIIHAYRRVTRRGFLDGLLGLRPTQLRLNRPEHFLC